MKYSVGHYDACRYRMKYSVGHYDACLDRMKYSVGRCDACAIGESTLLAVVMLATKKIAGSKFTIGLLPAKCKMYQEVSLFHHDNLAVPDHKTSSLGSATALEVE